jgi:quinol monooxygenase YgiN
MVALLKNDETLMSAFNIVRFRVKQGRDQEFLDAHLDVATTWPGVERVNIIQAGERSYCLIAEWADMAALASAREKMIATLNSFRDTLEDLGQGKGVTDALSGPVVLTTKNPPVALDNRRHPG